ncbi:MAG: hypothetical protein E6R03_01640 [Hyphomicrobiaceae bacterium]|nr:MAG: hypothetical protein E6R03_01640 [Hyphomicrobiaceae bacterium]
MAITDTERKRREAIRLALRHNPTLRRYEKQLSTKPTVKAVKEFVLKLRTIEDVIGKSPQLAEHREAFLRCESPVGVRKRAEFLTREVRATGRPRRYASAKVRGIYLSHELWADLLQFAARNESNTSREIQEALAAVDPATYDISKVEIEKRPGETRGCYVSDDAWGALKVLAGRIGKSMSLVGEYLLRQHVKSAAH